MKARPTRAFGGTFQGKRVLVTGLTGFKGAWLGLWLHELGAQVTGLSLTPGTKPSLFEQLGLSKLTRSIIGDIREEADVRKAFAAAKPQIVFHLAAQSLVRRSYEKPLDTFSANVLGTLRVLEGVHRSPSVRSVVVVTTDKCYRNDGARAFREDDPLGGADPYSASKACAEIAASSFRESFLAGAKSALSTARAGNVIGGGDWAEDRILPDCARALSKGRPIAVRNPSHTRPWQFVLEPLSGYLLLAARQLEDPRKFLGAWNFGPDPRENRPVRDVVSRAIEVWGAGRWTNVGADRRKPEKPSLRLDSSKARAKLGWKPVYGFNEAVSETVRWYRAGTLPGFSARELCAAQIHRYTGQARKAGLGWASP